MDGDDDDWAAFDALLAAVPDADDLIPNSYSTRAQHPCALRNSLDSLRQALPTELLQEPESPDVLIIEASSSTAAVAPPSPRMCPRESDCRPYIGGLRLASTVQKAAPINVDEVEVLEPEPAGTRRRRRLASSRRNHSPGNDDDGSEYEEGTPPPVDEKPKKLPKRSETHRHPWSEEEQLWLERLITEIPRGTPRRWAKISAAMGGTRTTRQVTSRVQKYFGRLEKVGVDITVL
ncbi:hypothetical protein EXIGLDRAFT_837179 [Exidia glandulosa HHB12029]|uniref:Uncharacterized protein n=1 Tax=Exidia glandulosa HHB12029 TaxID=1314781 RepID=A0A166AF91_EXIGL|nr:hypothetical protein EXIGLDRAFT_837179 [Exidia glandulosa HHB12029]